jgi:hypothetical protein
MNRFARFDGIPDDARLWVYGFDRKMDADTLSNVEADLDTFVAGWTSHEAPVHGAFEIVEDRFVLMAGWCDSGIGGCSIDSSVGLIRSFEEKYGLDGLDRDLVFFRDGAGEIEALARRDFQSAVETGRITASTFVFDVTIHFLGDLRRGAFETAFENCWHARVFNPNPPPAPTESDRPGLR